VNAQALQVTLKRLDLACAAFFRRVKAGATPGFPRFKPLQRFSGRGYKTHGDGWRLFAGEGMPACLVLAWCDCGANCSRDENAAKVMLNWALTGSATGQELTEAWSGGSSAVSKCEIPAVLA
jgi:transposase